MNSKKKTNLQELILRILSKKRASKQEDVIEQIEKLLDEESGAKKKSIKPKYAVNRAIKKMVEDEVISQYDTEQSSFLSLTSSGRQKLRNIKLSSQSHLISTVWDGYWRVIVVDIP
ncbi:hypothetical protein KC901_00260, partial [Patescibacteria group bacterium]|nr:hypothetical protein [Patescibacteria group bacterium]